MNISKISNIDYSDPAPYLTSPAYKITNKKLTKMNQLNRIRVLESLFKGKKRVHNDSLMQLTFNMSNPNMNDSNNLSMTQGIRAY